MLTTPDEKFEAFIWDTKFNTGVDVVDEQHHKLVDLINRLGAINAQQTSAAELDAILSELANYTVYHFDTEQQLMKQYAVDAAHQLSHIKAHQHFTAQVGVAAKILQGSTDVSRQIVVPLLKYLTNWLVQHILGSDMRMAQEILALQEGCSHADATRKANDAMTQAANVLLEALNEMYGKLGDKTLEVIQKNQELEAEREALRELNEHLELRILQRTAALEHANQKLQAGNAELKKLNEQLESAHLQLLQAEKMASVGQLAAGVAHEINNPVGFVNSNLGTLGKYIASLSKVIAAYDAEDARSGGKLAPVMAPVKKETDLSFINEDIPVLLKESRDGLSRVTRIVQDLMDFSHVDESGWQRESIELGMDSALKLVEGEFRQKVTVAKDYSHVPQVECLPSQINQVFMNLLLNAAQAIDTSGTVTIRSGSSADEAWIEVADSGKGIAAEHLNRIFEPFFTTKPVGKGTGLGLSLAYSIVQKHHGRIEVKSEVGKGSTFRVCLPLRQEGKV
jgi:hemerythrin-like metal-binding protein